jgi:DNA mismatch repair ATPase MutS
LSRFPRALVAIGHWETLAAFGAAAYENPGTSFPIICTDQTCLVAENLTHPLLQAKHAVANDIQLDSSQRLLLVSGTNMSGKSTLLRAVGLNVVLALAGGPVLATKLILAPFVVASAMRFQDSLGTGTSYFYAVLQRMRQVLEQLSQPHPLLFLLDEILPGTNSHDRLIGAEAIIRRLLAADALGLVTTHDLELTRIARELAPAVANMHFTDEVVAGKLHFDYRLRPGIVQSSNAIKLMRDMGIDV